MNLGDAWEEFSAVLVFLFELHQEKVKTLDPVHLGNLDGGNLWEPDRFIRREVIHGLRYMGSDRYNAILEALEKGEQVGLGQPAAASEPEADGKTEVEPQIETY